MSVTTIRNTINRINGDVVDLKKNQAKERKKELDIVKERSMTYKLKLLCQRI